MMIIIWHRIDREVEIVHKCRKWTWRRFSCFSISKKLIKKWLYFVSPKILFLGCINPRLASKIHF